MKKSNFSNYYCGPAGIDGIIFLNEKDEVKVHPCIEINFRYNMGYINLKLSDKLHPEAKGVWKIRQFKAGEWQEFAKHSIRINSVGFIDGMIISGFLPLVPVIKE